MQPVGSKLINPMPGTVVDAQVTRPEYFDFYLIPQAVGQGTVTPTHYNIIHFETSLTVDHMQKIAYKLCHIYYNWTVCISILSITLNAFVIP